MRKLKTNAVFDFVAFKCVTHCIYILHTCEDIHTMYTQCRCVLQTPLIAPKFLLTKACLILTESQDCGQVSDAQLSTTGVLNGCRLETPGGVFQKYSFQSPTPQLSQHLWAGRPSFNILKKYPHVSLMCNHS